MSSLVPNHTPNAIAINARFEEARDNPSAPVPISDWPRKITNSTAAKRLNTEAKIRAIAKFRIWSRSLLLSGIWREGPAAPVQNAGKAAWGVGFDVARDEL